MKHFSNKIKTFKLKPLHVLLISSLPLLTNCVSNAPIHSKNQHLAKSTDGIGGTGNIADNKLDGVGGTGNIADRCSGLGGTGNRKDGCNPEIELTQKPNLPEINVPQRPDNMPQIEYVEKPNIENPSIPKPKNSPDSAPNMIAPIDPPKPGDILEFNPDIIKFQKNQLVNQMVPDPAPQLPKPAYKPNQNKFKNFFKFK